MKFTRILSLTNFLVGASALSFQVFVLYPWHNELDSSFQKLKKEHLKVLEAARGKISTEEEQGLKSRLEDLGNKKGRWF